MLARLRGRPRPDKAACDEASAKKQTKRRSLKLSPSERSIVPDLIEPYRFIAKSDKDWQTSALCLQPCLQISVNSHSEIKGHTCYNFECSLSMSPKLAPYLTWNGKRRLQHLRKGLHDVAKRELGSSYERHFKDAPFARRGGVRGTTKRLNTWCSRLAECINLRAVPPVVVAQVLKLLDVPRLQTFSEDLRTSNLAMCAPERCDRCTDA